MGIPNYLTLLRIAAIPVFVFFFYLPFAGNNLVCATLFCFACLTDWLDGYLARLLGQVSKLGEFLDPVADKLIVAVALVLIVGESQYHYLSIPASIIVGREIIVSALREWMAEVGKRTNVAVSYVAKWKTAIQMLAIMCLLVFKPNDYPLLSYSGYLMLSFASILTLWSMFMYLKAAWPDLYSSRIVFRKS